VKSVELTGAPVCPTPAIWSASADLMVGSLTALTATHVQYGCTAVQICEGRMRPLDPLRALAAVRSYYRPQDLRSWTHPHTHAAGRQASEGNLPIEDWPMAAKERIQPACSQPAASPPLPPLPPPPLPPLPPLPPRARARRRRLSGNIRAPVRADVTHLPVFTLIYIILYDHNPRIRASHSPSTPLETGERSLL
jgi:hypothetical protein